MLQDDPLPRQAGSLAEDLVRDINRHAEVVLRGRDAMELEAAQGRGGGGSGRDKVMEAGGRGGGRGAR